MRVNVAVGDGSIYANSALRAAFARATEGGGDVHLLGLVSHGGVHSHMQHLFALLRQRDELLRDLRGGVGVLASGLGGGASGGRCTCGNCTCGSCAGGNR